MTESTYEEVCEQMLFKGDQVEVKELTDAEMPWAYQQFGLPY